MPEEMREGDAADEVVDEVVEDPSEAAELLHHFRGLELKGVEGVCPVEEEKAERLRRRRRWPNKQA